MKKTITIIALAALFVSCAKEVEQAPATSGDVITVAPTEFSATLETPEPDTKTTLDSLTVLWESGDEISVWPGVFAQAKYTLSAGAGTNSATFTLSSEPATGEQQGMFTFALYPYDADVELGFNQTGHGLSLSNVKYPAVQNYRGNSWDKGAMPMYGELNDESNSLQLRNLAGVLRLTLKGAATIDSIRVSALGENEYIAGVILDPISGKMFTSGEKTVTLKCGESGVTLSETEGTVFNIVIPPITGGFKVAICDSEHGVMILESESEIKRNTILNMPEKTYAPNAMDLGLSVYWATCNVGATTPEGYGDYFAWGETDTYYKDGHSSDIFCDDWKEGKSSGYEMESFTSDLLTKYNTDGKTVLESVDDAATAKWGTAWRMPTIAEFEELHTNCAWTWPTTTTNGVSGCNGFSNKEGYEGASIFLPAAGYRTGRILYDVDNFGNYWSSSLDCNDSFARMARVFSFLNSISPDYNSNRNCGLSIRPVAEK